MEKIKKIAKYTTNILGMIATIILGLNAIEGINILYTTQIVEVIAVIQGVLGTYLISGKLFETDYESLDTEEPDDEEIGE